MAKHTGHDATVTLWPTLRNRLEAKVGLQSARALNQRVSLLEIREWLGNRSLVLDCINNIKSVTGWRESRNSGMGHWMI